MIEYWDVYDSEGRPTGQIVERTKQMKSGQFHLAAELWLVNQKGQLLIQKRSAAKTLLPGIWAFTTGCMVAGENTREGAAREAREELGVALGPESLHLVRHIVRETEGTLWDIYCAYIEDPVDFHLQTDEVSEVAWVEPAVLERMIRGGEVFFYPEVFDVLRSVVAWAQAPGKDA
jgi:isopentenyldiphosphate isomerase